MSEFDIGDPMRKVVPKYSSNDRSFLITVNSRNTPKTDCCDDDQFPTSSSVITKLQCFPDFFTFTNNATVN